MGRPIKKTFFGAFNAQGVGGEGVATATASGHGVGYFAANVAVHFTAPQIAGGATATGTATLDTNGNVTAIAITTAGSGYTSAPTMTITGANTTPASGFSVTLTSNAVLNTINANAFIATGSVGKAADIIKQTGSKTFYVRNADGYGKCRLTSNALPASGEMTITATFADGSHTFNVAKITDTLVYDANGNHYLWANYTGNKPAFATASNATVPHTVSISNN